MVLYPALAAEILGMVLDQDQPIPLIKDKIEPQGPAKDKDAAAQNVNIKPFGISGVDAPTIVHANNDEINKIDDIDGNIMSIATVIHMPADCHLFPIYHLVCHTWVIGVDHEPITLQGPGQLQAHCESGT